MINRGTKYGGVGGVAYFDRERARRQRLKNDISQSPQIEPWAPVKP